MQPIKPKAYFKYLTHILLKLGTYLFLNFYEICLVGTVPGTGTYLLILEFEPKPETRAKPNRLLLQFCKMVPAP